MSNLTPPATVVITMAGFGQRFRQAGFDCPKYMIEARGRTLFEWSLASLTRYIAAGSQFVFVVRAADNAKDFIKQQCPALGIKHADVISLDAPTKGQATTARMACSVVSAATPFAIFNIDTAIEARHMDPEKVKGDGFIPCFDAPGEGWSFVRLREDGYACEVREKQRISNHASIGFYWFSSAALYAQTYDSYYGVGGRMEAGECYVAPLYNALIERGLHVAIDDIPFASIKPLGTPEQLADFLAGPSW